VQNGAVTPAHLCPTGLGTKAVSERQNVANLCHSHLAFRSIRAVSSTNETCSGETLLKNLGLLLAIGVKWATRHAQPVEAPLSRR
jgi:hypothetical protein